MARPLSLSLVLLWVGFFATSAYGHVALKLAVDGRTRLWGAAVSPLGLSAYLAWAVSAVLWMALLSKHSLFAANGISALRYALIAACAPIFLRESLDRLAFGGVHRDVVGDKTAGVRVGVIGYGYWGPNIVRNLSALDRCEVQMPLACLRLLALLLLIYMASLRAL